MQLKIKSEYLLLGFLFLLVLSIRLYFAFQTRNYAPESYYTIRQVDHILHTGLPIFKDDLSYGGRTLFQGFLYFYILAAFRLVFSENIVYKIIPNIFMASMILIVYAISKYLTKNDNVSLFSAYVAGFIPIFYLKTITDISVYTLVIPIILLFIFCMLQLQENKAYVVIILILILLLRIIHPSVMLLIISLLVYMLIIRFEGLSQSKEEVEIILFSTFLILWSIFITFKKPFLIHGIFVIWQNIPLEILNNYFKDISILESAYSIGLIPLIFGLYTVYQYLFKEKNRQIYLIISFAVSITLLLWLKLLSLAVGMLFLSPILVILFSVSYQRFLQYLAKTRLAALQDVFVILFIFIFFIFSIIPALYAGHRAVTSSVTNDEIKALKWIANNTEQGAVVVGNLYEGHVINTVAQRPNVIDTNFLLIKNIDQRLQDVNIMYTTPSETEAVRIIDKYNIGYILFSKNSKELYHLQSLPFVADSHCFQEAYTQDSIEVYKSLCRLES